MTSTAFSFTLGEPAQDGSSQQPEMLPTSLQPVESIFVASGIYPKEAMFLTLLLAAPLLVIGIGQYFEVFSNQEEAYLLAMHVASCLAGLLVAHLFLRPMFRSLIGDVKALSLHGEGLCAIGVSSLAVSSVLSFLSSEMRSVPWSPSETFSLSVSLLIVWLAGVERMQQWLLSNAKLPVAPQESTSTVLEGSLTLHEHSTPSVRLEPGMIVRIIPGNIVQADCQILEGVVELEERRLTGQPQFRVKGKGDTIFAGSAVIQGRVDCKVLSAPLESFITTFQSKISAGLKDCAELHQSITAQIENRASLLFLFIAAIAGVFWLGTGKGAFFSFYILGGTCLVGGLLLSFHCIPLLYRHLLFASFNRGIIFDSFRRSIKALSNIDGFMIDYSTRSPFEQILPINYEIVDERVDQDVLTSVVTSILARSDNPQHLRFAEFLRDTVSVFMLHDVSSMDCIEDPDSAFAGIKALVQGVPCIMGAEGFLIAAGVQVLASEVSGLDTERDYFFISMNGEIVARLGCEKPASRQGEPFVAELKQQGLRVVFASGAESLIVQPIAAQFGVDLSDTFSVMSPSARAEKLSAMSPAALFASSETEADIASKASSVFRVFDEYQWSIREGEIILAGAGYESIPWVIGAARRIESMYGFHFKCIAALSVLLLVGQVTGLLNPVFTVIISALAGVYLFYRRH